MAQKHPEIVWAQNISQKNSNQNAGFNGDIILSSLMVLD